ncbi:hypothetical protein ACQKII_20510 [Lysinibacillus sp. NPDC048646]|uniref:hypothetical protein n=1 Tax=Lysinibacillus sp. NPDC048646 TaxID=3390574 RepID=UPI003CFC5B6B
MGNLRKAILAGALACGIGAVGTVGTIAASGAAPFGFTSNNNVQVTADAWFTPSVKTTSSHGYDLTAGKNVQQSYVRIQEGNYDSGRVNSTAASSKTDSNVYHAYHSKMNAPFSTAYTSYGWYYFN